VVTKFSSVFLAFLLAGSLLWGPCAACAAAPVEASGHGCCGHHPGNCKTPAPNQPGAEVCPNLALVPVIDHQVSTPQVAPPALPVIVAEAPAVAPLERPSTVKSAPSPPGLYLLNSVLLV
jgi:hypothetical protein